MMPPPLARADTERLLLRAARPCAPSSLLSLVSAGRWVERVGGHGALPNIGISPSLDPDGMYLEPQKGKKECGD
jgi:hypothetical protein